MSDPVDLLRHFAVTRRWGQMEKLAPALFDDAQHGADAMALLARCLLWQNRRDEALAMARRAIHRDPQHWFANLLAYQTLFKLGRLEEGKAYLPTVTARTPSQRAIDHQFQVLLQPTSPFGAAIHTFFSYTLKRGMPVSVIDAPISNLRNWAAQHGVPIMETGEPEAIPYKEINLWPPQGDRKSFTTIADRPFVADLRNVRIFSRSSTILTEDGTALNETAGHPQFGHLVDLSQDPVVLAQQPGRALLSLTGYRTMEVEAAIFLSGQSSDAFGHWIPEFLPKLQALEQHPDFTHRPIVVDAKMPPSHFDLLGRIAKNPLIKLPQDEALLCRHLLVSPVPYFLPTNTIPHAFTPGSITVWAPRGLRYVRNRTAASSAQSPLSCPRIFLGRKNMGRRRLLNETDISADLAQLGFQTVYIESMTVDEQQALFRQAEWIVSPMGAAQQNLIYSREGTKLLVLTRAPMGILGLLQGPMEAMGYNLTFVCSEDMPAQTVQTEEFLQADFSVPLSKIRGALAAMGLPEAQG